jgi:hypothetical protein
MTDNARAKKREPTGNIGAVLKCITDVRLMDQIADADPQFADAKGRRFKIERAIELLQAELRNE